MPRAFLSFNKKDVFMANSREAVLMLDPARISGGPHIIVCAITRADLPDEMFDPQSANRSNGTDARFFTMGGVELPRHYVAGSFMLDSVGGAGDGKALYFVRFSADSTNPGIKVQYGGGLADYDPGVPLGQYATWQDFAHRFRPTGLMDDSGSGVQLSENGAPVSGYPDVYGPSGAYDFNGSTWLQDVNHSALPDGFFLRLWFQTDNNGLTQCLWSQGDPATNADWDSLLIRNGNKLEINRYRGSTSEYGLGGTVGSGWYCAHAHFKSGSHRLFLNGVLVDSNNGTVVQSTSQPEMYVGALARLSTKLGLNGRLYDIRLSTAAPANLDDFVATDYAINSGGAWTPSAPVSLGSGAVIAETLHLGAVSTTQSAAQLTIRDAMALGFGGDMGQGARNIFSDVLELGDGYDLGFDPRLILEDAMVLSQSLGLTDEARLTLQDTISLGLYAAELYLTGAREVPLQSTLRLRAERLVHAVARDGRTYFPKFEKRSPKP